jgi:hypothetical protein
VAYTAIPIQLEEHRERVLSLWKENLSDPRIADVADRRFSWFYGGNPAGAPCTRLLLETDSGELVGCGSFLPRSIVLKGQTARMGVLADFAVSGAHRAAGPAITIQRSLVEQCLAGGADFLAAYPNRSAEPIFKRLGYRPVGNTQRWVKPISSRRLVSSRINRPLVARALGGLANVGLAAMDLKSIAALPSAARALRGVYLDTADERFDALWEQSRNSYAVTGVRDAAYLNWRYRDFPSLKYRYFALLAGGESRVAAYLTYYVNANNAAIAGDLFAPGPEETLRALLLRFSAAERNSGRDSVCIEYLGPDSFGESLKRLGFYPRPAERSLFVHLPAGMPEDLQRTVLDKSNWFTLDAEMDI